jgi:hypothetical protein
VTTAEDEAESDGTAEITTQAPSECAKNDPAYQLAVIDGKVERGNRDDPAIDDYDRLLRNLSEKCRVPSERRIADASVR